MEGNRIVFAIVIATAIFVIGGVTGFFVCYTTNVVPLQKVQQARRIAAEAAIKALADSVTAAEQWIAAQKETEIRTADEALAQFITRFGDNNPQADEARMIYGRIKDEAKAGTLPYLIQERRRIEVLKEQKKWIESNY